ncbi:MAG: hypothetical protein WD830_00640 [Chloroflexota bacterium]
MDETPPTPEPSSGEDGTPRSSGPPGFPPPPEGRASPGFYPLDVDRVLRLTFSLFRFRWRTFLGITLAVMVPVMVAEAIVQVVSVEAISRSMEALIRAARSGDLTGVSFLDLIPWQAIVLSWLATVVLSMFSFIVSAAITHAAAVAIGGGQPGATSSLRAAFSRFGTFAGVYLVIFLVTLGIALIIGAVGVMLVLASQPGVLVFLGLVVIVGLVALLIFISVRWAFAVAVVMLEGAGAMQALGRSWRLATGSSWRVLGYVLLFGILVGLPVAVISFVVNAVIGSGVTASGTTLVIDAGQVFASTVATGLVASAFAPFATIAVTLLYLDLRFRRGEQVPQPGATSPG